MADKKTLCVIPARWGSTRFPGKSLYPILGKPLVQWVYERACKAGAPDCVAVATDDARIFDAVQGFGGKAVMTSPDHASGTDRVAEAARCFDADLVVNVQGDEPLMDPALIDRLVAEMRGGPQWDMATAASQIRSQSEAACSDVCKVVFDFEGRALYFSRSVIPHIRDASFDAESRLTLWWRHIGIYAYRREFLDKLVAAPRPPAERAESLEQLRALHIGGRIKVCAAAHAGMGVDRPEDAAAVEAFIKENTQWFEP